METFPNLSSNEPTGQLPRTSTIEIKTEPLSSSSSIQPRHPTTESQEPPHPQESLQPQVPSTPTPSSRKSYASVLKTPPNPPTRLKAKLTSASQSPGPFQRQQTRYQTFCSRPFRPSQDTYRTYRLEDLTVALPIHGKSQDESEGILNHQSLARGSGPQQGGLTQAKQTVPDDTEDKDHI
ncbi:hypothetical protein BJX66DRAFT_319835 [Aspergillus keveii]|uniref:Uncharacterized protein n=1 Tax=Aspergillus keveii TaxID=714993 RepID=A0ABR4FHS8_9EURO